MKKLRVLVACEFSGIVRDAFAARGHDAWSCDLLPSESQRVGNKHIQDNVIRYLDAGWNLMIAHPPCTYLTVSANKWYKDQPSRKSGVLVGAERRAARLEAIEFFMALMHADIPQIAVENPIGVMSTTFRKPDQVLQPWMFGHGETKATCLWLKNLPLLIPTDIVPGRAQRLHRLPKTANRWALRSKTFSGIARAMSDQWSEDLTT